MDEAYSLYVRGEKGITKFLFEDLKVRVLGRLRHWWKDDIKTYVKERGCELVTGCIWFTIQLTV
jgi:hypothetical protein